MQESILPGIYELEQQLDLKLHAQIHEMLEAGAGDAAFADTRSFFEDAECRCADIQTISDECDFGAVQQLFVHLAIATAVETSDDESLELTRVTHIVTENSHPHLWQLFFQVPESKNYGLENENHGHGYHVHYVDTKKKAKRTNAVFTFDPTEVKSQSNSKSIDTLYWYKHAGKLKVDPTGFSVKRKKEVHRMCVGFLAKIARDKFLKPPRDASKLWP